MLATKTLRNYRLKRIFVTQIKRSLSSDDKVIKSSFNPVNIPQVPLQEMIWKNLDKWAHKVAAKQNNTADQVCLETNRSYTYEDLYRKSWALTKFLKDSLGLKKSDTAAVVLPNLPEYPIIVIGCFQAGIRVTTCNPTYTSDEIKRQLIDSDTKLVFTSAQLLPLVQNAIKDINKKIFVISINDKTGGANDGAINFFEAVSGEPAKYEVNIDSDKTCILPYSSGTTGLPKGVELTHRNLVANLLQISSPEVALQNPALGTHQDIIPAFLPFFHIYGIVVVLFYSLMSGSKLVTFPKFSSQQFIRMLEEHRPSIVYGIPIVVLLSVNNPDITPEKLATIRAMVSGAAPLGAADMERFYKKTNNKINLLQAYGMTETSPCTLFQTKTITNGYQIGGSGLVVSNTEAKIVPLDGGRLNGLGPNQPGELLVKGPQVMKGYFNNPKATEEVILEDGWFRTGDIGYYDETNHFFITDRLKELIKVKGFQVAPAELEELLRDHPNIEDAAVVGIPHPTLGEAPKAFVVKKADSKLSEEDVKKYVESKVSKHKHLEGGVIFIDHIPKSASGKILRRELKNL